MGIIVGLLVPFLAVSRGEDASAPQKAAVPARAAVAVAAPYPSATSMDSLDDTRKIQIGDRFSFRVVEDRKLPVGIVVLDSGMVEAPLIGRIRAEGKTCKQLASEMRVLLEKDYYFKATVVLALDALSGRSRGKVYLTGMVRSQGPLEIPSDETLTLSKAIIKAGGVADFGDSHKVKVVRKKEGGGTDTSVVNIDDIIDKGHVEKDIVLEPDDMIIVPRRMINF